MGPRGTGEVRRGEAPVTPAPGTEPGGPRPEEPAENGAFRVRNEAPHGRGDDVPATVRPTDEARPPGPPVPTRRPNGRSGATDPVRSASSAVAPPQTKGATMNDDPGSAVSGTEIARPSEAPGSGNGGSTATGDGGGGSPAPGSGARRRRRRGGRGRGGRSGSGAGATTHEGGTTTSAPGSSDGDAAPSRGRGGSRRAESPTTEERPEVDLDAQPGEVERAPTGPRPAGTRRRSRGRGRGRGGSGGGSGAAATGTATAEATPAAETATETEPVDGQAEGSTAATTGTRRRRSRGGRGRSKAKPPGEAAAATDANGDEHPKASTRATAAKTATRRKADQPRKAKADPKTTEKEVERGAPTRLRRQRQGRTTVRRRRESMPVVPRITDKVMVITQHGERDQIAVLEERELVQHYVTRAGARSMVGNVYLGRVQNVLPGMEAAFVDVGRGRNAVLYAGEVNWSPEDLDGAPPRIEHVLKNGQSVLVQVTKDPIGGKGARLTAQISLPGRFLVLAPNSEVSGISRRLPDGERRRLKTFVKNLKPKEHGLIVRTAAEGASEEALAHDLARLLDEWAQIEKRSKKAKAPAVLYEEPELTVRVVRDLFTDEEYRELITDSPRIFGLVTDYLRDVAPEVLPKVRLHEGPLPAFEEFHIVEQIHKGLDRKVWLPSGGYLVIDRTEAMTVIDVNTGKSVGKSNLEETVVNTNLEAAREVARQLRLRDIGGMIVIDFIDMLLEQNKAKVIDAMRESLAQDKSRSQVFDISPLGLLEVTRKRVSGGLLEAFSETCPTCEGRGLLITYDVN
jgi:ribonuclease E